MNTAPQVGMPVPTEPRLADFVPRIASDDVVRVGVIGYGYWGPNIVRNFHGLDRAELVTV